MKSPHPRYPRPRQPTSFPCGKHVAWSLPAVGEESSHDPSNGEAVSGARERYLQCLTKGCDGNPHMARTSALNDAAVEKRSGHGLHLSGQSIKNCKPSCKPWPGGKTRTFFLQPNQAVRHHGAVAERLKAAVC